MANEQVLFTVKGGKWRIILCSGMWGIPKYEVEMYECFWRGMYDGENDIKSCFRFMVTNGIIEVEEAKEELKRVLRLV